MENIVRVIMNLIACEVCGKEIDITQYELSREELEKLYELSKSHDLAHIVGNSLIKNGLVSDPELKAGFKKQIMTAVYRYEKLQYELTRLKDVLNEAKIPFIPLKGSVIRKFYPEPWLRTSCDIDVLVKEKDIERASELLTERMSYKKERKGSHDVSLFSESGIHLELHYSLIEEKRIENAELLLQSVWDHAAAVSDTYEYILSDEMFYYYHIVHMAKHFVETGGCGIRPFLDVWVLNHRIDFDREKREKLLSDGGLDVFAKQAEFLSEVWFGNAEHTEISKQMEEYILRGGVYGTSTNRVAVQQQKRGGKVKYALSRIFIPYDVIKFHYPILQKHKWLTPIMEVRRWGKLIFCGHLKRTVNELKYNGTISEDSAAEARTLLKNVGL